MCPMSHRVRIAEAVYLGAGPCPRCNTQMIRVTDALAEAALRDARDKITAERQQRDLS